MKAFGKTLVGLGAFLALFVVAWARMAWAVIRNKERP